MSGDNSHNLSKVPTEQGTHTDSNKGARCLHIKEMTPSPLGGLLLWKKTFLGLKDDKKPI